MNLIKQFEQEKENRILRKTYASLGKSNCNASLERLCVSRHQINDNNPGII